MDKKARELLHQGDFKWHFNSLEGFFFPLGCISLPLFGNQWAKNHSQDKILQMHQENWSGEWMDGLIYSL
jgi:hypothetical protein